MTAVQDEEKAEQRDGLDSARPRAAGPESTLSMRWFTTAEAARQLRISEAAVRRQIADRKLTAIRAGRGLRVLLPDTSAGPESIKAERTADQSSDRDESAQLLAQTSESLLGLVRELQRQSLALAAQVGFLQDQLAQAQKQVQLLTARDEATVPEADVDVVTRQEHASALAAIADLRQKIDAESAGTTPTTGKRRRRWWPFSSRRS